MKSVPFSILLASIILGISGTISGQTSIFFRFWIESLSQSNRYGRNSDDYVCSAK